MNTQEHEHLILGREASLPNSSIGNDLQQSRLIYGKVHHKPSENPWSFDDAAESIGFDDVDLQGVIEISLGALQERLQKLGIESHQLIELFPEVNFTGDTQTVINLSKTRLVKTLRDMKIYEEDLFEQLHDLIPNARDKRLKRRQDRQELLAQIAIGETVDAPPWLVSSLKSRHTDR
jgi:hypothetical protein